MTILEQYNKEVEEFDNKTNPDNFETDEYCRLLGEHLMIKENYPEHAYELDAGKIKQFHKASYIRQLESVLEELPEESKANKEPGDWLLAKGFNNCLSQTKSIILEAINNIQNN